MAQWFNNLKEGLMSGFKGKDDDDYDDSDDYDEFDNYGDGNNFYNTEREEREHKKEVHLLNSGKREQRDLSGTSRIVNINTNVQMQVVISYPQSVEEAGPICDYVRSYKTVVINLENVKHDIAQRIVDFLGGVAYALDGDVQSISNKVFIIAPQNVDISGHFKEELKANGILFSFNKSYK